MNQPHLDDIETIIVNNFSWLNLDTEMICKDFEIKLKTYLKLILIIIRHFELLFENSKIKILIKKIFESNDNWSC